MNKRIISKEDKKYSDLWQNGYKDARWKKLARKVIKENFSNKNISIIDFGFGKASAMDYFKKNCFDVHGIEISSYAVQKAKEQGHQAYYSNLDNLIEFTNNQFDIGFCNDVIEHVPKGDVEKSLSEMARICSSKLYISVCPTPSHHKSLEGEPLHLTVRPKQWWEQQLNQIGKIKKIKFPFSRSLRYSIEL